MTTPEPVGAGSQEPHPATPPQPQQPYQQPQYYPPSAGVAEAPPPPAPPKKPIGLALTAIIVGGVAFLTGWVPVLGLILGLAAIALGIIALVKKQSKGLAITGLALGTVAAITSLIMTVSFGAFLGSQPQSSSNQNPAPAISTTPEPVDEEQAPEPTKTVEPPAPVVPATPDLSTFGTMSDRDFALLAKDPDAYTGTNLIIFGVVTQFDSATGRCVLRLNAGAAQTENSFDYEQNSIATSGDGENDCPVLDPVVQDDHVKLWVTVLGSFSYDTQIGGNTTVPAFHIWQVEQLPAQEY